MLPNICSFAHALLLAEGSTGPWQIVFIVIAALMGMGVVKLIGYLRKHDAEKEAQRIIKNAEIQASARHKEAEFEAKRAEAA